MEIFRWMGNKWKWVGKNDGQIKIIFALVAACYVIFEYRQTIRQAKVATALKYIDRYEEGATAQIRDHLTAFWISEPAKQFLQDVDSEKNQKQRPNLILYETAGADGGLRPFRGRVRASWLLSRRCIMCER
jgi:hypothetical protein